MRDLRAGVLSAVPPGGLVATASAKSLSTESVSTGQLGEVRDAKTY
jgi:hypothetical protein